MPAPWKLYLGIMASSCYESTYLLTFLEEQFIQSGGDPRWLRVGLDCADWKLRRIAELNEILAYRPWTLNLNNIEALLSCEMPPDGDQADLPSSWSIQELLHAGAILAHFHSLCGLLFGQGVKGGELLLPDIERFWDTKDKTDLTSASRINEQQLQSDDGGLSVPKLAH